MPASVSAVLERRALAAPPMVSRKSLVWALALHAAVGVAWFVVPRLTRERPKPINYVAVAIVPAQKLGIDKPQPAKVEPPKPAAPKPEPKPDAPVLPDPRKTAKPKAEAPPEPVKTPPVETPAPQGTAQGVAQGQSLATSVAGLDNPSFTYGYYVDQMLSLIARQWVRPPVGSGVETIVGYRIQRSGQVTDVRIVQSSGINSFDLAALRAVQSASPLPPLPSGFRDSSRGVQLIVR